MVFLDYQVRQEALGQSKEVGSGAAPENVRARGQVRVQRQEGKAGRGGKAMAGRGTTTRAS